MAIISVTRARNLFIRNADLRRPCLPQSTLRTSTCMQAAADSMIEQKAPHEDIKSELERTGYLILPDFASKEQCEKLKTRANELVDAFDPVEVAIFSTTNQEKLTTDYFMDSAAKVSFFFEEGAFAEDGSLVKPKALSINKMGHAMHDLDPVFREFSRSDAMKDLYRQLGFQRPLPVQSMYIFKQPAIGGPVVPHQDSAFLTTEPLSCVGIWLAIEDATVSNGCLFSSPGNHAAGLRGRMTAAAGGGVSWPTGVPAFDDLQLAPLEVTAGTLVVLHGSNVHGSSANTSPDSRHAYSMHVVEGAPGTQWLPDNWLQRPPEQPFEPLYE
eukprot:jgi/Ulvmu1/5865/UM025_0127.1